MERVDLNDDCFVEIYESMVLIKTSPLHLFPDRAIQISLLDWNNLRDYFLKKAFSGATMQIPLSAKPKPLYSLGYLQGCIHREEAGKDVFDHFNAIKDYVITNDK